MRKFFISILLILPSVLLAQQFNEYDRKVFNEGQVLTNRELQFAAKGTPWSANTPRRIYSIHDEGDETIVTFSYSIYFDSQWVSFSKGIYLVDDGNGDIYKVRGYAGGLSMDRLLIIKGCKSENVLISLRFPKLRKRTKTISIYNPGHPDDIKPSNRSDDSGGVLASKVSVKKLRKVYKEQKVNVFE